MIIKRLMVMERVIIDYLKCLDIPFSENYCKKVILSHPDYPSILSVSDAFSRLGIPCQIGRIEEEHLPEIEFPFIIHLESSRDGLILIKNAHDLSKDHIDLKKWNGIVLKAESVEKIKDSDHNEEYVKERVTKRVSIVLMLSLLTALMLSVLETFSWINTVLISTSILGGIIGYILIAKEFGVTFKPIESFCNTSTRVNCDKILTSDGAKILSFFSLSDAVFSYFSFQLIITGIVIRFSSSIDSYLWVLAIGSGLSIPMVIYSIYYQAVKAKTWCKLCVLVNAILIIQASFFSFLLIDEVIVIASIEFMPFINSLFLFVTITAAEILLKEQLVKTNKAVYEGITASRLRNDPEVFTQLLFKGQKVDTRSFDKRIHIGNPNAPIQLIMVANLHCHPCKSAFETVAELISTYPNKVCCEFFFLLSGRDTLNGVPASSYLIRYWEKYIASRENESKNTQKMVRDWYVLNSKEFLEVYSEPIPTGQKDKGGLELSHYAWITQKGITRTPTFYINGYSFPAQYSVKDIRGLVPLLTPLLEDLERKQENKCTKEYVQQA